MYFYLEIWLKCTKLHHFFKISRTPLNNHSFHRSMLRAMPKITITHSWNNPSTQIPHTPISIKWTDLYSYEVCFTFYGKTFIFGMTVPMWGDGTRKLKNNTFNYFYLWLIYDIGILEIPKILLRYIFKKFQRPSY